MNRLSDNVYVDLWPTVDANAGVVGAVWYNMGDMDEGAFILEVDATVLGTLDIEVWCASDALGTGAEQVPNAAWAEESFAIGAHKVVVEFSSDDIIEGKPYVSLRCLTPIGFGETDPLTVAFIGYELRKQYANVLGATSRLRATQVSQAT